MATTCDPRGEADIGLDETFKFKLDGGLLAWLRDDAQRNHRSVGGQIRHYLHQARETAA
jgi:hypothetical protein